MAIFEVPPQATSHYTKDYIIDIIPNILTGVLPFSLGALSVFSAGGKDELFSYKRIEDIVKMMADASGNPIFSIDPSRCGEIELSVMHTNPVNAQFQRLATVNTLVDAGPRTDGQFTTIIKHVDAPLTPLIVGRFCRIANQPESKRAKEADEHKWRILVGLLIVNEAGVNADFI